jgi:hypothetical protein
MNRAAWVCWWVWAVGIHGLAFRALLDAAFRF